MKALIAYATRYGATTSTSEEIAKVLREQGINVDIVNAKEAKIKDIVEYELVIVGSGIQIDRWTGEAEDFLKRFQKELAKKNVALFVSSGGQALAEHEGNPEKIGRGKKKYLEEKATKYNLQPIALGLFGGVYDFNRWPWWINKKIALTTKQQLEATGLKEIQPGVYDTRDWNNIRSWAKELVQKILS